MQFENVCIYLPGSIKNVFLINVLNAMKNENQSPHLCCKDHRYILDKDILLFYFIIYKCFKKMYKI